jgi:hypothetical protein
LAKRCGLATDDAAIAALQGQLWQAQHAWLRQHEVGRHGVADTIEANIGKIDDHLRQAAAALVGLPDDVLDILDCSISRAGMPSAETSIDTLRGGLAAGRRSAMEVLRDEEKSPDFKTSGEQGGGAGAPAHRLIAELHLAWWRHTKPTEKVRGRQLPNRTSKGGAYFDQETKTYKLNACGVFVQNACELITQGFYTPTITQIRKNKPKKPPKNQ